MLNKKNFLRIIPIFIAVLLFLLPLAIKSQYLLHIIITIFVWIILTLGIRLILLVGHLNLAQAGFMGLGAYASGLLALRLGLSFWLCMPVAGLVSALIALVIGYPILRTKHFYFVMVTFALTEVFRHIWMRWYNVFGGPQGLLHIPRPDTISIGGLMVEFTTKVPFYYLALILMLITVGVMYRIDNSRLGIILKAIPQSELLAECIGVNVMRYKILAFVISSFFAGVAGSFYAHYFTYASPWDYSWLNSFYMLMYVVVGGQGSVFGPIIGTSLLIGLEEILRPLKIYVPLFLGVIVIGIMIFLPGGLISLIKRIRSLFGE